MVRGPRWAPARGASQHAAALVVLGVLCVCVSSCPTPMCTCGSKNEVDCSSRRLERVPHFTSRTSDIVYELIDLSENAIDYVAGGAFQAVQSRAISLSHNPLIGLSPRAFQGLEHVLRTLDLYDTEIYVLHWGVLRNLHALLHLNLARNGMFALPTGLFDGLSSLQDLQLAWNKIASVTPGAFRNLRALQSLNLLGNQITDIAAGAFEKLHRLQVLNLNNNQLRHLNPLSFQGLYKLEKLLLEENLLSDVPSAVFTHPLELPSLKSVNLAKNNISQLGARSFSDAVTLEEILLQENHISNISSDAFLGLEALRSVRLDDNKLQTFGEDCVLRGLEAAQQLALRNNPVDCTCRIAWLHRLKLHGTRVEGQCVSPAAFAGVQLASINFTLCEAYKCHSETDRGDYL